MNLDREALALGGYREAAELHDRIADQRQGSGEPYFDRLEASHRRTATLLRQRAETLKENTP